MKQNFVLFKSYSLSLHDPFKIYYGTKALYAYCTRSARKLDIFRLKYVCSLTKKGVLSARPGLYISGNIIGIYITIDTNKTRNNG